jgi:hypothetical protein
MCLSILESLMGTTHGAEELGLCPHGLAYQAGAWGRYIVDILNLVLTKPSAAFGGTFSISWVRLLDVIAILDLKPRR